MVHYKKVRRGLFGVLGGELRTTGGSAERNIRCVQRPLAASDTASEVAGAYHSGFLT